MVLLVLVVSDVGVVTASEVVEVAVESAVDVVELDVVVVEPVVVVTELESVVVVLVEVLDTIVTIDESDVVVAAGGTVLLLSVLLSTADVVVADDVASTELVEAPEPPRDGAEVELVVELEIVSATELVLTGMDEEVGVTLSESALEATGAPEVEVVVLAKNVNDEAVVKDVGVEVVLEATEALLLGPPESVAEDVGFNVEDASVEDEVDDEDNSAIDEVAVDAAEMTADVVLSAVVDESAEDGDTGALDDTVAEVNEEEVLKEVAFEKGVPEERAAEVLGEEVARVTDSGTVELAFVGELKDVAESLVDIVVVCTDRVDEEVLLEAFSVLLVELDCSAADEETDVVTEVEVVEIAVEVALSAAELLVLLVPVAVVD